MEDIITNIVSALVSGGGGLYIGFRFLNRNPNGSSKSNGSVKHSFVSKLDCEAYKNKNSAEHKEIFETLTDIKENTATLLERTKKM